MPKNIDEKKAQEYLLNYYELGNQLRAYQKTTNKPYNHCKSYASTFHKNLEKLGIIDKDSLRKALLTEERHRKVIKGVDTLLNSNKGQEIDKGISHYREITGSDAPKKTEVELNQEVIAKRANEIRQRLEQSDIDLTN